MDFLYDIASSIKDYVMSWFYTPDSSGKVFTLTSPMHLFPSEDKLDLTTMLESGDVPLVRGASEIILGPNDSLAFNNKYCTIGTQMLGFHPEVQTDHPDGNVHIVLVAGEGAPIGSWGE